MKRLLPALVAVCAILVASSTTASAFDVSIWGSRTDHPLAATEQPDSNTCVAASSLTWINYINHDTTNADYVGTAAHNKIATWYSGWEPFNRYTAVAQDDPKDLYGIDPEGWAWLMYGESPFNYTFNDYNYTDPDSADDEIVYGIRITDEPVGVLVAQGNHAMLAVGYSSSRDPQSGLPWVLYGINVIDPWYADGSLNRSLNSFHGADYDLRPDQYIAINTWKSDYFKKYKNTIALTTGNKRTIWGPLKDGSTPYWVLVLRKDSTTQLVVDPGDADPPYADSRVNSGAGLASDAVDVGYASLSDALLQGIADNHLDTDDQFGVSLNGAVAGAAVFVTSEDAASPDYYLLDADLGSKTVAVAIVTVDGEGGLHFGGIAPTNKGFRMPTATDARQALGLADPSTHAVWRATADSPTPFDAVWIGVDSYGRQRSISMRGDLNVAP